MFNIGYNVALNISEGSRDGGEKTDEVEVENNKCSSW